MSEILIKIARWWNGVWYVPRHAANYDEYVEITFP